MLQKEREFAELSVAPDRPLDQMFLAAPDSPDGKRGIMSGVLHFSDEPSAALWVHERLVVRGNSVHRDRYSYALVIDGAHEYGWERDHSHDPAVHEHEGSGRKRIAAEPIALKRALTLAWEMISRRVEVSVDESD